MKSLYMMSKTSYLINGLLLFLYNVIVFIVFKKFEIYNGNKL